MIRYLWQNPTYVKAGLVLPCTSWEWALSDSSGSFQDCLLEPDSHNQRTFVQSELDSADFAEQINILKLKLDTKRLYRFIEVKKWTTFTGKNYPEPDQVEFIIRSEGSYFYTINFPNPLEAGEYAISLSSQPESLRLFGID